MNRLVEILLERPVAYRTWQSWHARQKFAPVLAHNNLGISRRVLDVGCGPGTNVPFFRECDYWGIDINPKYVESARRRFGLKFIVADATTYIPPQEERFDLILANSFFHHVGDEGVRRVLSHLPSLLADTGSVNILDLVLPHDRGVPRLFARMDRGRFPRPFEEWCGMFSEFLEPLVIEPFPLAILGFPWLDMVYFKGRAKR